MKVGSVSTKVRPVFGASAKGPNGLSLNDCVEVGPMLMPNLQEVLIRFRRWRFGLSADIVKAFHQIHLADRDLDVHRFLWCSRASSNMLTRWAIAQVVPQNAHVVIRLCPRSCKTDKRLFCWLKRRKR